VAMVCCVDYMFSPDCIVDLPDEDISSLWSLAATLAAVSEGAAAGWLVEHMGGRSSLGYGRRSGRGAPTSGVPEGPRNGTAGAQAPVFNWDGALRRLEGTKVGGAASRSGSGRSYERLEDVALELLPVGDLAVSQRL